MGFQSNLASFFYEASEEAHATGRRGILTNQLHGRAQPSANMMLLGKKKASFTVKLLPLHLRWN